MALPANSRARATQYLMSWSSDRTALWYEPSAADAPLEGGLAAAV